VFKVLVLFKVFENQLKIFLLTFEIANIP